MCMQRCSLSCTAACTAGALRKHVMTLEHYYYCCKVACCSLWAWKMLWCITAAWQQLRQHTTCAAQRCLSCTTDPMAGHTAEQHNRIEGILSVFPLSLTLQHSQRRCTLAGCAGHLVVCVLMLQQRSHLNEVHNDLPVFAAVIQPGTPCSCGTSSVLIVGHLAGPPATCQGGIAPAGQLTVTRWRCAVMLSSLTTISLNC